MHKYSNFLFFLALLPGILGAQESFFGSPGERYREFSITNTGNDWRVTHPKANPAGAKEFLPNPVLELELEGLSDAVRAQVIIDYWGGHTQTINRMFRVNENEWIRLPYPTGTGEEPWNYLFQFNPVLDIPLSMLKEGINRFEGTCGHRNDSLENGWNWGQWGWYSITVRLFYPNNGGFEGEILLPVKGDTLQGDQAVKMKYSDPDSVVRSELFAWYYGYDENGNGRFLDWHGILHYDSIQDNATTIYGSNNTGVWDTRWIPEQDGVMLMGRILDRQGYWHVTDKVDQLVVWQPGYKVILYAEKNAPGHLVRDGYRSSGRIPVPEIKSITQARLSIRTWNGYNHGDLRWLSLNCSVIPQQGKDHNYYLHHSDLDPGILTAGDNVFMYNSQTHHHGVEILWPGPALLIKREKPMD